MGHSSSLLVLKVVVTCRSCIHFIPVYQETHFYGALGEPVLRFLVCGGNSSKSDTPNAIDTTLNTLHTAALHHTPNQGIPEET